MAPGRQQRGGHQGPGRQGGKPPFRPGHNGNQRHSRPGHAQVKKGGGSGLRAGRHGGPKGPFVKHHHAGHQQNGFSPAKHERHQKLDGHMYAADDVGLKAGAELLMTLDHKQARWWDVEGLLAKGNEGSGSKGKKNDKKGMKQHDQQYLPRPSVKRGEAALTAAQELFEARRGKKTTQDMKWTEKVVRQGTLSDKIAGLTLLIQEAPLFRLKTLDALLGLASKPDRRCAQLALEACKDLLLHNLLPDRKLSPWGVMDVATLPSEHEGSQPGLRDAVLAVRYFEDQLKQRYAALVSRLEKGSFDTVENFKRVCINVMVDLLEVKPEQEETLLAAVVNKLGDKEKKVAPMTSHVLRRVLASHPAMKTVVAREVQQFLHRPNLHARALYNGITFLDQLYLSRGESALAAQLITTYFGLFDRALKSADLGSKMLSALLTGVNRAYPYLDDKDKALEGSGPLVTHIEELFRTVHKSTFKTGVQALMLLQQVVGSAKGKGVELEDRFYRALYDMLKAPELLSTASPVLFLNLLYKAMKADRNDARVQAFAKRLLGVALQASAAMAAGCIFLLSEVASKQPVLLRAMTTSARADVERPYDPTKREPSFALGDATQAHLWELVLLRAHYHPSVQHFAEGLLTSDTHKVAYAGDPLTDFSVMAFLDRFSYKNPKQKKEDMPETLGAGASQRSLKAAAEARKRVVMNTPEFLSLGTVGVGADQLFFHKFFREKADREKRRGLGKAQKPRSGDDDDDDEDDDDEDAEEDAEDAEDTDDEVDDEQAKGVAKEEASDESDVDDGDVDEAEIDEFATQLGEQLMRAHGKPDFDDEDPDFDEWDMKAPSDDDDEDDDGGDVDEGDDGEEGQPDKAGDSEEEEDDDDDDDDDAAVGLDSEDDAHDDDEDEGAGGLRQDGDSFMDMSDDSGDDDEVLEGNEEDQPSWMRSGTSLSDDDDEGEDVVSVKVKSRGGKKRTRVGGNMEESEVEEDEDEGKALRKLAKRSGPGMSFLTDVDEELRKLIDRDHEERSAAESKGLDQLEVQQVKRKGSGQKGSKDVRIGGAAAKGKDRKPK